MEYLAALNRYPLFGDIMIDVAFLCGIVSLFLYLKYKGKV